MAAGIIAFFTGSRQRSSNTPQKLPPIDPYQEAIRLIRLFGNQFAHINIVLNSVERRDLTNAYNHMLRLYSFIFESLINQSNLQTLRTNQLVKARLEKCSFSSATTESRQIDQMVVETANTLYDIRRLRQMHNIQMQDHIKKQWQELEQRQADIGHHLYAALILPKGKWKQPPEWIYEHLFSTAAFLYQGKPYYWGDLVLSWGEAYKETDAKELVLEFLKPQPQSTQAQMMVGNANEAVKQAINQAKEGGNAYFFNEYVIFWTIHAIEDTLQLKLPQRLQRELFTHFADETLRKDISFALAFPMKLLTNPIAHNGNAEHYLNLFRMLLNLMYGHIRPRQRKCPEMQVIIDWISKSNKERVGGVLKSSYPFCIRSVRDKLPMERIINPQEVVELINQLKCLYERNSQSNGEQFEEWAFTLLTLTISIDNPSAFFSFILNCFEHPFMQIKTDDVIDFCTDKGHKISRQALDSLESYCKQEGFLQKNITGALLASHCEKNKFVNFACTIKQILAFFYEKNRERTFHPTVSALRSLMREKQQDTSKMTVEDMLSFIALHNCLDDPQCDMTEDELEQAKRNSMEKGIDLATTSIDEWVSFWRYSKPEALENTATLLYELMHHKGFKITSEPASRAFTYVSEEKLFEKPNPEIDPIAFNALYMYCIQEKLNLNQISIFDLRNHVGAKVDEMIAFCKEQSHEFWLDDEQTFLSAIIDRLPKNLSGPSFHFFRLMITRFSNAAKERVRLLEQFDEELKINLGKIINSDHYFQALHLVVQKKLSKGLLRGLKQYEKCYSTQLTAQVKVQLMVECKAKTPKEIKPSHVENVQRYLKDLEHKHRLSPFQHAHVFLELLSLQENPAILFQNFQLIQSIETLLGFPMVTENAYHLLIYHPDLSKTKLEAIFEMLTHARQTLIVQEASHPVIPFDTFNTLSDHINELVGTSGLIDNSRMTEDNFVTIGSTIACITTEISSAVLFTLIQHLTSSFPTGISPRNELEFSFGETHHALLPLHPIVDTGKLASGHWRVTKDTQLAYRFSITEQKTLTTYSGNVQLNLTLSELKQEKGLFSLLRQLCWSCCTDTSTENTQEACDRLKKGPIDHLDLFLTFYPQAEKIWADFKPQTLGKEDLAPILLLFLREIKVQHRQALIHLATRGEYYHPKSMSNDAFQQAAAKMHITPCDCNTFSLVPSKVIPSTSHHFRYYAVTEDVTPAVEMVMKAEEIENTQITPLCVTHDNFSPSTIEVSLSCATRDVSYCDETYNKLHEDESKYNLEGKCISLKANHNGFSIEATVNFPKSDFKESARAEQCMQWLYARLKAEFYRAFLESPAISIPKKEGGPSGAPYSAPVQRRTSKSDSPHALSAPEPYLLSKGED